MQTLDLVRRDELAGQPAESGEPAIVITEAWTGHTSGYLARVDVSALHGSPLYEWERSFVRPSIDQRSAWGNGRRVYRVDEPGVYEVESRWHGGEVRRHWFEVDAEGNLRLLADRDEAMARLWDIPVEELHQRRLEAWEQRPSRGGWQSRQDGAASENRLAGLPDLEGSARQVAYAEVIRQGRLAEIRRRLGGSERIPWGFSAALAALEQHTDAGWWIDNRRRSWRRLLFDSNV